MNSIVNHSQNIGITSYGVLPEISNASYLKFKENAIKFAPKNGRLDFSKFQFEKDGKISYKTDKENVPLNVSENALRKLSEELGLNKKFNPGQPVTRQLILNVLKEAKNNMAMNFSMNSSGEITHLSKKDSKMVDYNTYFSLFERIMNDTNELELNQLVFNETDGSLMINSRSNHQMGFDSEIFNTGISYNNRVSGFDVSGFVGRLVCSNGMIVNEKDQSFKTDSLNQITIPRYLEFMKQLKNNHYQPLMFTQKWEDANKTQASLAEVQQTVGLIENSIPEGDLELYLPGYGNMISKVSSKIGPIETLSNESLVNLKSPFKMEQCLNAITDVASHTEGISGQKSRQLQVASGKMLYKNFDVNNIFEQIF